MKTAVISVYALAINKQIKINLKKYPLLEYAFHIELNISVLGEQAQRLKLLSKVILHISGEMPSLYLIKKNPLNATMRNSYIPVGN